MSNACVWLRYDKLRTQQHSTGAEEFRAQYFNVERLSVQMQPGTLQ
jgi:hypothetical protein